MGPASDWIFIATCACRRRVEVVRELIAFAGERRNPPIARKSFRRGEKTKEPQKREKD